MLIHSYFINTTHPQWGNLGATTDCSVSSTTTCTAINLAAPLTIDKCGNKFVMYTNSQHQIANEYHHQIWPRKKNFFMENVLEVQGLLPHWQFNSSDAGDRILWLWGSLPCLLMHWILMSPEHQQAWCWLCRTDNIFCLSRINLICLSQAKSKIQLKINFNVEDISTNEEDNVHQSYQLFYSGFDYNSTLILYQ